MCLVDETMSLVILRTSEGGEWMQNRNEVLLQLASESLREGDDIATVHGQRQTRDTTEYMQKSTG
jgi:hypothetical protein